MNRLLAVIFGLAFAFMVIVDITVLTSDGSIRWGRYILFLLGTALLGYLTVMFWRRGGRSADPVV